MNKEQFDFAFFLSCQLPMREGRLEDIGTTCLLFTTEKLPSWWTILTLKGVDKTCMKAAVYLLVYSTSQGNLKNKVYRWQHSNRVLVTHREDK